MKSKKVQSRRKGEDDAKATTSERDWFFIIVDAERELRVVCRNGKPVEWRRLSNVMRGARLDAARRLASECMATGQAVVRAGFASPVAFPGSERIRCVLLSLDHPNPVDVPDFGLWSWKFTRPDHPPELEMSDAALVAMAAPVDAGRREKLGPQDFYHGMTSLGDVLSHVNFLHESALNAMRSRRFPIRTADGSLQIVQSVEVVSDIVGVRVVHGVVWVIPATDAEDLVVRSADMTAGCLLASVGEQAVVVTDVRFTKAPYTLKWMSSPIVEMEGGVSHGANESTLHPDDHQKIADYVREFSALGPDQEMPEMQNLRVRRSGGGWISGTAHGHLIDPCLFPTVWIWRITMETPIETGSRATQEVTEVESGPDLGIQANARHT